MFVTAVSVVGLLAGTAAASDTITRSYQAEQELQAGFIVSADQNVAERVVPATRTSAARVLGIVVPPNQGLIAVDPDVTEVSVAVSGNAKAWVSNANGQINEGDLIAVSPFEGIGMKLVGGGHVIGVAAESADTDSDGYTQQTVTDSDGRSRVVDVATIDVIVSPRYVEAGADQAATGVQEFVRNLTGRIVSLPRIIAAIVVAVITLTVVIILVYASIYGSVVSIGRNPLARVSVLHVLGRVMLLVAGILLFAFALIFLLLR